MKRILMSLLLAAAPSPALAQHAGHAPAPPARPAPPPSGAAGQGPHEAHTGHRAPPQEDPHAGHRVAPESPPTAPPAAPPPPEALTGPDHAADRHFDPGAMATARAQLLREHGDIIARRFTIDRLELSLGDGGEGYEWDDAQFWYGSDLDRLWIKSQGEGRFGGELERAEVQALWSHALDPWFDLQAGVRYDPRPNPEHAYLVLGIQGLSPYWFEIDATAFLSTKGDLSARIEAEYDQRITQRLILQPRIELDLALQDVPELGVGSGLSTAEAGLRLRYEIVRELAPYVGVQYRRAFGDTARFAGDDVGGWSLVAGIRAWF